MVIVSRKSPPEAEPFGWLYTHDNKIVHCVLNYNGASWRLVVQHARCSDAGYLVFGYSQNICAHMSVFIPMKDFQQFYHLIRIDERNLGLHPAPA